MLRNTSILFLLLWAFGVNAQVADTSIISESAFLKHLQQFAPQMQNANLQMAVQEQGILSARAAFEPKLNSSYGSKQFDDKSYYSRFDGGIDIKTRAGIKVGGGYAQNSGLFLNPENNLPEVGLVYAGVEVPLGAGLLRDQERTDLAVSQMTYNSSQLETELLINDYVLYAGEAFWQWYASIEKFKIAQEAQLLAFNRLEFVKRLQSIGEAATIDTLEAFINYQNRQAMFIKNRQNLLKQTAYLQRFTWNPDWQNQQLVPLVDTSYRIVPLSTEDANARITNHPQIQQLNIDSMFNQTEALLNREFFKPKVNMEFRLQETPQAAGSFDYNINRNHYVGMKASMPLLLRKQRAKNQQFQFKSEMIINKRTDMIVKLQTSLQASITNSNQLLQSVGLWRTASLNYKTLLDAEIAKYNLGESSLFVINNREIRWLYAREKYIDSYANYRIELLRYYHSLALLPSLTQ
jgi:outer membrane protein TolC